VPSSKDITETTVFRHGIYEIGWRACAKSYSKEVRLSIDPLRSWAIQVQTLANGNREQSPADQQRAKQRWHEDQSLVSACS
jgi:hypothetical protein